MSTEELIREIISKMCPLHGKHANVEIHEEGQINISACCAEFHEQMEKIIAIGLQKPLDVAIS
ncbi:MAG: hypothetical protein ABI863_01665 [Ginsengibacter sp.]